MRPYGELGLVNIAATPAEFIEEIEKALSAKTDGDDWLRGVDGFLSSSSWDETWALMSRLIDETVDRNQQLRRAVRVPAGHKSSVPVAGTF